VSMAWPQSLVADATAYLLRRRSRDSAAR
jgi:hypothetical protein